MMGMNDHEPRAALKDGAAPLSLSPPVTADWPAAAAEPMAEVAAWAPETMLEVAAAAPETALEVMFSAR